MRLQLSARADHRVLKLARTIADLAASDHFETTQLAQALHNLRTDAQFRGQM